ncbi:GNAT family N-acetyltransferase [Halalkalibacterium halodurans]|uniref:BH0503 protein n=1 Tax=Halalkalibacterium halodurans (strain ATCC BAA-125 / DSM 18197 / FERM 7344 / JCM 9153 / C-125) TaxID=272558 RepID=Q9KFH6_HALH5|nr:GNAT family N-acetyltransferase [Halalkalibacterium halodurans]MDY7221001.1 GNAT family N-acetyltransferase [Halalkalibacterium halodurans]MDY7240240.1 GNAT family N-acetyltransferase [Halalkalibacterium halodurans]MED4079891.1 GNAT family N-acetyltransferase [Halalkalibacterium halodurans]MED4085290.1 GNAT family N-acetyltransferase [Halalkalibacterium halodurans]MED4103823.1 GNAT family N-acetyltransferase [Halalkalibacterium halodurans]
MENATLILPSLAYQNAYLDMLKEWGNSGETPIPFTLRLNPIPFEHLLKTLKDYQHGVNLPANRVANTTYWLVHEQKRLIGAINIRHTLNDWLHHRGGHIGYGIRPSERGKGYATLMLKLGLEKAAALGLEKVLITCDKENLPSARTIQRNGGVLDSEVVDERGIAIQRYWIKLT